MFESKWVLSESCSKAGHHEQPVNAVRQHYVRFLSTRFFVCALLLLLAGLVPLSARAEVTCNNQSGAGQILAAGSISVPANTAIGTTVSTLAPVTYTMQCRFLNSGQMDTSATNTANFSTTAALASGADVYQTGISGLGVRYIFNSSACNATNVIMTNGNAAVTCAFSGALGGAYMPVQISVTAQLVVTDPIQGGISSLTTAPTVAISFKSSDSSSNWPQPNLYTGIATGTLTQATCSVTQANVAVSLPNVGTGALFSSGSTAGSQAFSLSFNCSSGAKVLITLTDNVNPANQSNTLQLTADSTARGLGVQILNHGLPISFGPDSATVGNTNQWLIGASPNGPLQVPLTARYINTGTVAAGTVKALATFTMSYQ
ncbi:fimbrial protein [Paraburkholderia sediminicola]|uniref:fimbrial protein n=1 Tax=Paraburkholderia sediminicola TaxID=458836 RepID=UPI0038BD408F